MTAVTISEAEHFIFKDVDVEIDISSSNVISPTPSFTKCAANIGETQRMRTHTSGFTDKTAVYRIRVHPMLSCLIKALAVNFGPVEFTDM